MENSMGGLSKLSDQLGDPFKQKGGTFGLAILAIAAGLVIFNISALVALASNIFWLAGYGVATAALLYVAFDKNFRLMAGTWYMIQVKRLLSIIVKMDPIAILKDGIRKMYNKIAYMEKNMEKLDGVRLAFKDKIRLKKKELKDTIDRVNVAEKLGNLDVALIEKRQVTRLTELTESFIEMSDSAEKWYGAMSKIAEMAKLYAKDSENEVNAQEEKYKMIKLSHSAFTSAMSVLKGDPDELALFNQAFQYVSDDIMNRVGEMDRVINTSGGLLDKINVEKEIFGIKGDDLMKKYNEIGIEGMFTGLQNPPSTNDFQFKKGMKFTTKPGEKIPVEDMYKEAPKSKYL